MIREQKTTEILEVLSNPKFTFRTIKGIAKIVDLSEMDVASLIDIQIGAGIVRRSMLANEVFGLISRVGTVEEVTASLNETSEEDTTDD